MDHHPIEHLQQFDDQPFPSQHISQYLPGLQLPFDVPLYQWPVIFRLIQGTPKVFELIHPSTSATPSLPYKLNSIYLDLSAISTYLWSKQISVAISYLAVLLCLHIRASGMCIPQWLHRGRSIGSSCRIYLFSFQLWYIKCSLSLPRLCALSGNPYTGHATKFKTCWKDTTYCMRRQIV